MTVEQEWKRFEAVLRKLTRDKQVAFATFSCAAVSEYYEQYCGQADCRDREVISSLLNAAWEWLARREPARHLASLRTRCEVVAADLGNNNQVLGTAAQEVCFAGLALLEMLEGKVDAEQGMRVVSFSRDIVDMLVQERIEGDMTVADLETRVLADPLMIDYIARHQAAVELLNNSDLEDDALSNLRQLARAGGSRGNPASGPVIHPH
jgi:uncharacterized protein YjaG (DUF416 family)